MPAGGEGGGGSGFIVKSHPMMVFQWWCILVFGRGGNGRGQVVQHIVIYYVLLGWGVQPDSAVGSRHVKALWGLLKKWWQQERMPSTSIDWFFAFILCLGLSFNMYLVLSTALSTTYV
jgi:hypothetical protein